MNDEPSHLPGIAAGGDAVAIAPPLADALAADGYAVVCDLLPRVLLDALRARCAALDAAGALQRAATGRGAGRQAGELRGDATRWLDAGDDADARFLAHMDALRAALNPLLMAGLVELEAHYACYPPGAGYARHRDRFRDDDARVLSLVLYLNDDDWRADDGGALRLHLPSGPVDVSPHAGVAVLFRSDAVEHEVLPARRVRRSIAGWFRRRTVAALR